ncbi:MAG: hypothetical protein WBC04_02095 [Candidatus Acidiferrales bacterium]
MAYFESLEEGRTTVPNKTGSDSPNLSRTSVMPYKNSKKSMREIASELRADAVIEGSVMRSADRARITVQLIDASSDQHLWAESYERDLNNVFALQSEVAQAIAQQVRVVITPQEQAHLAKKRPMDPEVYELYGTFLMSEN